MKPKQYGHVMGSRNVSLELNTWFSYGGISIGTNKEVLIKVTFLEIFNEEDHRTAVALKGKISANLN